MHEDQNNALRNNGRQCRASGFVLPQKAAASAAHDEPALPLHP
jgi:hypothetical protein